MFRNDLDNGARNPVAAESTGLPLILSTGMKRMSLALRGRERTNDAERLSMDPTFRVIGSQKICEPHDGSVKPRTMPTDHNFTAWERSSFFSIPLVLTGHFEPQSRRPLRRPGRSCQPNAAAPESRSPGNCSQDLGAGVAPRFAGSQCAYSCTAFSTIEPLHLKRGWIGSEGISRAP